jgi:sporulation protein YlmC with PRC-barrel domain
MRLQQLRGLPVVDPVTARKVGVVTDYRLDAVAGRLAAIEAGDNGGASQGSLIPAASIRRVGRHAIMLTGDAVPDLQDDEAWLTSRTLVGLAVLSTDGTALGRLADAELDADNLSVGEFLLQAPLTERLFGRQTRPMGLQVTSCSRELLVVVPQPAPPPAPDFEPDSEPEPEATANPEPAPSTSPIPLLKQDDQAPDPAPGVTSVSPADTPAPESARANGHNY